MDHPGGACLLLAENCYLSTMYAIQPITSITTRSIGYPVRATPTAPSSRANTSPPATSRGIFHAVTSSRLSQSAFQFFPLSGKSKASSAEKPELGATDRRQIRPPLPEFIGFDVAGTGNVQIPELPEVDRLVVKTGDTAGRVDDEHHAADS